MPLDRSVLVRFSKYFTEARVKCSGYEFSRNKMYAQEILCNGRQQSRRCDVQNDFKIDEPNFVVLASLVFTLV